LDFLRPSAAEGGANGCGVDDRETQPAWLFESSLAVACIDGSDVDVDDTEGESILISSLIADDPARGKEGGGVCAGLSWFQ
jgi:hypothetical protein